MKTTKTSFRMSFIAAGMLLIVSSNAAAIQPALEPDEKYLYIADSGSPHHIRRLPVGNDNRLGEGQIFAVVSPGVPDGIRVDASGRLYSTAGDGVQVFDTNGKLIGKIRTPQAASNCCFGGAENKTLFITARDGVFAVELSAAEPVTITVTDKVLVQDTTRIGINLCSDNYWDSAILTRRAVENFEGRD